MRRWPRVRPDLSGGEAQMMEQLLLRAGPHSEGTEGPVRAGLHGRGAGRPAHPGDGRRRIIR